MRRLALLAVLVGLPVPSALAQPANGAPPPETTDLPRAIDMAFGRGAAPQGGDSDVPPPQGEFDPGYTERQTDSTADRTYGPARAVGPTGEEISGVTMTEAGLDGSATLDHVPDYHVVQTGDTLWDISGYYLTDPYQWPKLWSWNDHVTNAHWIFPGDRIRLFDPFGPRYDPTGPSLSFSKTKTPLDARRGPFLLEQLAFVDNETFTTAMTVAGDSEAHVMMATLDTIYMDYDRGNPPVPGERLVVYSPQEKVLDADGKKVLGWLVQIAGDVEVETIANKAVEGTVWNAVNPIERGYKVGPLVRRFRRIDPVPAERSAVGRVVTTLNDTGPVPLETGRGRRKRDVETVLAGETQFVVVDLGKGAGVREGNVLEVVHKGDEYTEKRVFELPYEDGWPRRVVAALLVVQVDDATSLAVTIYSRREIERGDPVELRGPEFDRAGTQNDPIGGGRKGAKADADVQRDDDEVKGRAGFQVGG